MICCGADVDEVEPTSKSRPLHIIAKIYDEKKVIPVIRLLLDANAHIDCINSKGYLPEQIAWRLEIRQVLQANRKLSLKCQCARLINLKTVSYMNYLSSNLIAFVRMHGRN